MTFEQDVYHTLELGKSIFWRSNFKIPRLLSHQFGNTRETRTGQWGHIIRCAVGCSGSVLVTTRPCKCAIDRLSRKPQQASHCLSNRKGAVENLITPEHESQLVTHSVFYIFPYTIFIHFWPLCHFGFGQ